MIYVTDLSDDLEALEIGPLVEGMVLDDIRCLVEEGNPILLANSLADAAYFMRVDVQDIKIIKYG